MRHRMGIGGYTGLGNPAPAELSNTGKLTKTAKQMLKDATELYFKEVGGCDYEIRPDRITFGIEPAYQYETLKIICIDAKKGDSYIEEGKAWGAYGSGIARKTKYYRDYKYNGKFKKFVDRWHDQIFAQRERLQDDKMGK